MMQQPESPISVLKTFIENENIKFQELNLFSVDAIPAEIKTVMIVGPQYDFSDREMKMLRDFWNKQGRILLLLDPSAKTPKLDAFLNELGVRVNDDRLMAFVRTGIEEMALTARCPGAVLPDSPITKQLADVRDAVFRRHVFVDAGAGPCAGAEHRARAVVQAEKGYWAEIDYNSEDQAKLQFDAKRDHGTRR